jgi:HlyD family secretion protein
VKELIKHWFSVSPFSYLLLLIPLVSACGADTGKSPLLGVLQWDRIAVVNENPERIVKILVREGERVQAGQVLILQDSERAEIGLKGLMAQRAQVAARLAELVRGPRQEQIAETRAVLQGIESERETSEQEYVRIEKLFAQKLASQAELDRARVARDGAEARSKATQEELNALLTGTTREELDQVESALREVEAQVRLGEIAVERHSIKASRDGVVDMLPYKTGALPAVGATVATILDTDRPYVRVYIPEPVKIKVSVGSGVEISIDGLTGSIPGKFRWISADPAFTPYYALTERDRSRLSFLAEIDLQAAEQVLNHAAGVPVQVHLPGLEDVP